MGKRDIQRGNHIIKCIYKKNYFRFGTTITDLLSLLERKILQGCRSREGCRRVTSLNLNGLKEDKAAISVTLLPLPPPLPFNPFSLLDTTATPSGLLFASLLSKIPVLIMVDNGWRVPPTPFAPPRKSGREIIDGLRPSQSPEIYPNVY